MEDYVRIALITLAAIVLFLVIFELGFRRRKLSTGRGGELASMMSADPQARPFEQLEPTMHSAEPAMDFLSEDPYLTSTHAQMDNTEDNAPKKINPTDIFVLMVLAKPDQQFASYELLQAIYSAGLQFGEMNIFHFYQMTFKGRAALFSLASATEPGEFDLDKMGEYTCNGLTLFADLSTAQNPQYVFELMLKTAEQLADDLDGELRAGPRLPWSEQIKAQYQQKITQTYAPMAL